MSSNDVIGWVFAVLVLVILVFVLLKVVGAM